MTGEPTLHYGDQSADGWVEYAQQLLLDVAPHIKIDGIFLDETIKAVYEFQQAHNLMVDGVIGNQTWSVLRDGEQAEVGTDGHQHQDTDQTTHAVFFVDQNPRGQNGEYDATTDSLTFFLECVGAIPIPGNDTFRLDVNISAPDGGIHHKEAPLGNIEDGGETKAGDLLMAEIEGLKAELGTGDFTYAADIPDGLGGGRHEGPFTIAP
jgi:hypothetical protein